MATEVKTIPEKKIPAYTDDVKEFRSIKTRYDTLIKEMQRIHGEWLKLHQHPRDAQTLMKEAELLGSEATILAELQELFTATNQLLNRNLKRFR
jgi:hypothetical protein